MLKDKKMTPQQALFKLTTLCSQAEHCAAEMEEKLRKWQLDAADRAEIMAYLVKERYVDDARFARFFINDKIRFNKWGRRKVELALYQKRIPREISDPIFEEIDATAYEEVLLPMLQAKWKTIKAKSDYERSMKLIKFAMGRGFGIDIIRRCVDQITDVDAETDFMDED